MCYVFLFLLEIHSLWAISRILISDGTRWLQIYTSVPAIYSIKSSGWHLHKCGRSRIKILTPRSASKIFHVLFFILVMLMREKRNAHSVLVGKPKGKKPLRKPRLRWEDYVEVNVKGWDGVTGYVRLRTDMWRALVNTVMNLWVW